MTTPSVVPPPRVDGWIRALVLGLWLSLAAVWPASRIVVGKTGLLWQPLLVLTLFVLTLSRARRCGWAAAVAQSLFLYAVMTLAGWLPWLRTIPSTPEFPYPSGYRYYLMLYEAALASLVGFQAYCAASGRAPTWWPAGDWTRPLAVAPVVLVLRAIAVGHWLGPLVGAVTGAAVAARQPWKRVSASTAERAWRLAPWALYVFTALVVFAAGMRLYWQLGPNFRFDSDDGTMYYEAALRIAEDPRHILNPAISSGGVFNLYMVVMGLWFRLVGPHMPSWLMWQAAAAGLLAVVVYRLGQRITGNRLAGLVAAVLVLLDHVMLHLLATLNMEVAFIPALYVAVWLWSSVPDQPPSAQVWRCLWAGLMVGVATLFRPTSGLLPLALVMALFWEHPKLSWRGLGKQAGWMFAGFAAPVSLLLLRNRLAWGYWTLGSSSGSALSWDRNYAWMIQGQHPYRVGWGPWLELLASDPSVIWRKMIPDWWTQILFLWTHRGFGQMDVVQGLNYPGFYQAALAVIVAAGVVVGIAQAIQRRSRTDAVLLMLPAYFTSLTFVYWVINTRYRAPFIPALSLLACLGFSTLIAGCESNIAHVIPKPLTLCHRLIEWSCGRSRQ